MTPTYRAAAALAAAIAWYTITVNATSWPITYVFIGAAAAAVAADLAPIPRPYTTLTYAAAAATWAWVLTDGVIPTWGLAALAAAFASALAYVAITGPNRNPREPAPPAPSGASTAPLRRALAASGIRGLTMPDPDQVDPVTIGRPRRIGLGDTYTVHLPDGVTTGDLGGRAERVAGALGRPVTDVTIDVGDHASEAVIWVGDKGAGAAQAGPWRDVVDYPRRSALDPICIGLDRYGVDVTICLHGGSGVLIGSQPGKGKSALMNLIIAAVLADPRVVASFIDLKGGGDFTAWSGCAVDFYSGAPDENPARVLEILERFRDGIDARYARMSDFRAAKIGERIADETGMGPTILVVDEAHELLGEKSGMNPADRDRAIGVLKSIIARGRAVNAWVLIASQRVTDDEIPASITQRVTTRVAFRLGTQPASEAVLGPDTWRQGWRATQCPAPGVGLIASDDGVGHLRAWYVSDEDAYRLAEQAARRRIDGTQKTPAPVAAAARPTGAAAAADWGPAVDVGPADTEPAAAPERVVDVLTRVWPDGLHGPLEAPALTVLADAAGMDADDLETALLAAGAPIAQVRVRAVDGSRPRVSGMRRDQFEDWRAGW